MKKIKIVHYIFLLTIVSLCVVNFVSAFDWSRITGFAIKPFEYNITCVDIGTQVEGPTEENTNMFSNVTLALYNSRTNKYSKIHSDSCIKKRKGRDYTTLLREAYCIKRDTRFGRRDEVKYNSKSILCENGCLNGACIKSTPAQPSYCNKILDNGEPNKKVDIVFVADNYTDLSLWLQDIEGFIDLNGSSDGFFSVEPMKSNKTSFNIWRIDIMNQTFMDSSYGYWQLTAEAKDKAKNYTTSCVSDYDMIFLVVDTYERFGFGIYGSNMTPFGRLDYQGDHENVHLAKGIMLHEFGHAFVNLGDEYANSLYVFYDFNRPNLDREGCPKWCSGELNKTAECYVEYWNFRTCLYNLTNNLLNPENYQLTYDPANPLCPYPDAECNLGVNCRNGTGCYWNGHALTSFMSSPISIMSSSDPKDEFNLISQEVIANKINSIIQ
jgi:hypothetical protein